MYESISFPNLGISLENVGKSISVFGFEIAYYGLLIGLGIMLGVALATYEAKRTGQDPETYFDLTIYGIIVGISCARLYYVIFSWEDYKDNLLQIFNIRQGGLAIYGGVIGVVITIFVYAKVKKLYAPQIMDTVAMSLLVGQIIGRWGNFFNREAFGEYTDCLFAMRLPYNAVRVADVTDLMMENMYYINEVAYIQVHPTFLYESLWNVGVLIILFCYRKRKKFEGELFLMYLGGYGLGRFWVEGLRTDQLQLSNGWAVSQLLAIILFVGSIIAIAFIRNIKKKEIKE